MNNESEGTDRGLMMALSSIFLEAVRKTTKEPQNSLLANI
jgi:hypothetical protein